MARHRLISSSLGTSEKFHALATAAGKLGEFAQLLFPLIVTKTDDYGRMAGDAFTVKLNVFPSSPRPQRDFECVLNKMAAVGLIQLYEFEGKRYLEVVNFRREQPGLKPSKYSRYPDPPESTTQETYIQRFADTPGDSRKSAETPGESRLSVSVSVSESASESESPLPPRGDAAPRLPDPPVEVFEAAFRSCRDMPYGRKPGDFVQLANLRRRLGIEARASPVGWSDAVANYFATALGKYTLADLCSRFDVFRKSALDRYGKPLGITNQEPTLHEQLFGRRGR